MLSQRGDKESQGHNTSAPESRFERGGCHQEILAIDCETITCNTTEEWRRTARNSHAKLVPVAARYAIVDCGLGVVCHGYIKPPLDVEDWKGLRNNQTKVINGEDFNTAREKILRVLKGKRVVVHHYRMDFDALKIYDFPEEDIRDTSTCLLLREKAKITSTHTHVKLKVLAREILKEVHFQPNRRPHNPIEDAKMTMRLYKCVEKEWK